MWNYREPRMVEMGREAVGEWALEGSFERIFIPVGADGTPPVIHRGTYDGTCSERTFRRKCQFGWYRRSLCFCPIYVGRGHFLFASIRAAALAKAAVPHLPPKSEKRMEKEL